MINLEILRGEVTAFVGSSGAGKSTMMALILKFIHPKNGEIYLDNRNIKYIKSKDIRSNIALVQQQPFLFSGKIIDVIKMGRNYSKDDVMRAAKIANAHNFVQNLPNKYETMLSERGSNFSGGQIQRISISRALYSDKDFLILDESTNALDEETESKILREIEVMTEQSNLTVLIISHKKSILKICNKIVEIKNKQLVNFNG